ncbi:MAG: YraN family protein [Alphaproteobacteria bacterium]|nr:YraN family protein [Alphaproteobacteria bacterium]
MGPGPNKSERQKREATGRWAETLAVIMLRLKFYRILARRYRCPVGEIDIVAVRRKTIVFVEVKARRTVEQAMESVTSRQQQRITRAATAFLQSHPKFQDLLMRFDALLIVPKRLPHHVKDAWRDS